MKIFKLYRDHFNEKTTLGELLTPNGEHFCFTLEDVVRGFGEKVFGKTAIPYWCYKMEIRVSPKYGEVVVIYTDKENGSYFIRANGIEFEMILAHGGNDHEDTHGCVLVNKTRDIKNFKAQGSMKDEFVKIVKECLKESGDVYLDVLKK